MKVEICKYIAHGDMDDSKFLLFYDLVALTVQLIDCFPRLSCHWFYQHFIYIIYNYTVCLENVYKFYLEYSKLRLLFHDRSAQLTVYFLRFNWSISTFNVYICDHMHLTPPPPTNVLFTQVNVDNSGRPLTYITNF